jgi:hypothetical protein
VAKQGQNFKLWAGSEKDIDVTIEGYTSLAGAVIEWAVGRMRKSTPLFTLSSTAGDITTSGLVVTITVPTSRSTDLEGFYCHQLKVTDATGNEDIVTEGRLRVLPSLHN